MRVLVLAAVLLPLSGGLHLLEARQALPLDPPRASGLPVSPIFEGWYRNPDGTFTLSFGYINRNLEEAVDIPVGAANRFSPGEADRGQPTHFLPRRHYGVFTVRVPADFGMGEVVWTVDIRGERFAIPGRLNDGYELDAVRAPATGISAPLLRLDPGGPQGQGPEGVKAGPVRATVGVPLELPAWTSDDGGRTVTLRWSRYRGPAAVSFDPAAVPVERTTPDGRGTTQVTFSAPGEYVLHVSAHNTPVASAGHAQCCWTNGYVTVVVSGGG